MAVLQNCAQRFAWVLAYDVTCHGALCQQCLHQTLLTALDVFGDTLQIADVISIKQRKLSLNAPGKSDQLFSQWTSVDRHCCGMAG